MADNVYATYYIYYHNLCTRSSGIVLRIVEEQKRRVITGRVGGCMTNDA